MADNVTRPCPTCSRPVPIDATRCVDCWAKFPAMSMPNVSVGQMATLPHVDSGHTALSSGVQRVNPMNSRIVIPIGIIILVIGVALIIISPNLLYEESTGDPFRDPLSYRQWTVTAFRDLAFWGGILLLIVGGIVAAVGFGSKKAISPDQQRPGILLYRDGKQYGPYQMEAIMEWYKSGKLSEKDIVFVKGSNQWVPVASFLGMNNSTVTSPASNTTASLDELEKLASLKEKGIITEEEYEKKKKQILGI